ncbi:MAG: AP-3 complex subunit beta [Bogoriella megaspora]|nr:MAG: AP-3 complex subunit beta [Bogoriella megaspora]
MESISRISSMLETGLYNLYKTLRNLEFEADTSSMTARDLTLDASSSVRRSSTRTLPPAQIKKLLDSRTERDILEGLRKVIAMQYRTPSPPTLPYFTPIIKNLASPSLEVRKLIYIYLLHHAPLDPDTTLLSINTIQKSLSASSPQERALALRVMSGIRVPVISQIVSLGIKKACGDMNPLVRRTAALAIPKCWRLDPNTEPQLLEYLGGLLGDKQYYVAGAAVMAFLELPGWRSEERLGMVHPMYRGLVRKMVDMDEWAQLATLRLMLYYGRRCFPRRKRKVQRRPAASSRAGDAVKEFYGEELEPRNSQDDTADGEDEEVILDPDLELLLNSVRPLLQSRNSAVITSVARLYLYLGTPDYIDLAIGPLIALLRSAQDMQQVALQNIVQVCLARPRPFVRYLSHFLVRSIDSPSIWRLKLEVLTLIFPHAELHIQGLILRELEHFSRGHNVELVRESVRAIGRCAQSSDAATSARCLKLLLSQISSADGTLVAESLEVIRHLIQRDPHAHIGTVTRLAKNLDTATSPQARASIIWLVGEFAGIRPENNIAADVLRILAKGFAEESEAAKLQIVLLAAKVYVHYLNMTNPPREAPKLESEREKQQTSSIADIEEDGGGFREDTLNMNSNDDVVDIMKEKEPEHPIAILWRYILLLARYDTSYDLRDRARLYKTLLSVPSSTELASLLLLAPKPVPQTPSPSETRKDYLLGTASLIVGDEGGVAGIPGYEPLPSWVKDGEEPDPKLRDEGSGGERTNAGTNRLTASERLDSIAPPVEGKPNGLGGSSSKEKTLDDWLDEEEESGESSESEETDEESSEDESEDESEENDEDDRLVK